MLKRISTDAAPQAIGPYSQAVRAGDWLYCSGQIPLDPATMQIVAGDVSAQTERVLKNLEAVLQAAGAGFDRVVKCQVFLKDMGDFAVVNEIYGRYFQGPTPPARATVEVARLPKDVAVEIDCIAYLG
ncbi:MAG: RidA family protein [Planctomycetota bacterium]